MWDYEILHRVVIFSHPYATVGVSGDEGVCVCGGGGGGRMVFRIKLQLIDVKVSVPYLRTS